jgi:hypothetical protein
MKKPLILAVRLSGKKGEHSCGRQPLGLGPGSSAFSSASRISVRSTPRRTTASPTILLPAPGIDDRRHRHDTIAMCRSARWARCSYGPAVMGDVSSDQGLSFRVIGDTVNTASRLQGLTRDLKTPWWSPTRLSPTSRARNHRNGRCCLPRCRTRGNRRSRAAAPPSASGRGRSPLKKPRGPWRIL